MSATNRLERMDWKSPGRRVGPMALELDCTWVDACVAHLAWQGHPQAVPRQARYDTEELILGLRLQG